MSISKDKILQDKYATNVIQSLSDNPNESGLNAENLKIAFDAGATHIKNYIHDDLIDDINSEIATVSTNTNTTIGQLENLTTTNKSNIVSAANEINAKLDDTGWVNIPLASGVTTGSTGSTGGVGSTPQYRKIGKTVFIKGFYGFTKAAAAKTLATLPEGFRPVEQFYITSATSGARVGRTYVTSNGEIGCDWIYNLNGTTAYTGDVSWYDVTASFPVS